MGLLEELAVWCEPVAVNDDGWSEWLHPQQNPGNEGFLMECCDCGLVHTMQFAIAPSETACVFNDGETPDGVVLMRGRRTDPTLETEPCENGLLQAIREFRAALPGWWYSLGECDVSCDASCAPTRHSPDTSLIDQDERFNSGFHCDARQPSTLAEALRDVTEQAVRARHALALSKGSEG